MKIRGSRWRIDLSIKARVELIGFKKKKNSLKSRRSKDSNTFSWSKRCPKRKTTLLVKAPKQIESLIKTI
jgi:hypothetical protein